MALLFAMPAGFSIVNLILLAVIILAVELAFFFIPGILASLR